MRRIGAFVRAGAAGRSFASPVRELRAGAMLYLAGCSSGRGDCARGGRSARRCGSGMGTAFVLCRSRGSLGMSCARITPAVRFCWNVLRSSHARRAVLIAVFCARLTPAVRSCWNGLRLPHARRAFLLECSALDHACCLTLSAKQDGLRDVAFLFRRGSESPLVRSHDFARLSNFAGSLRICPFLYGDSDGVPEEVQEAIGKPPGERTSLEQKSYPCAVTP